MSLSDIQSADGGPNAPVNNAEPLHDAIGRGLAGKKVDHPNSAAAPLGADTEAAGTPVGGREVSQAAGQELHQATPRRHWHRALVWLPLIVVVGAAAALVGWMRR
jgi:hypothetical protein